MASVTRMQTTLLLEVDGIGAHEEDAWCGQLAQVGTAVVEVLGPVPRCVVTSQNPQSGAGDFDTLKAILAYRGALSSDLATPAAHLPAGGKIVFGVYGRVVRPGRIELGDAVAPIDTQSYVGKADVHPGGGRKRPGSAMR